MTYYIKDIRGFTMIEFMISVLLLAIAIGGLISVGDRLMAANTNSRNTTAAVALAQEKMEIAKRQALTLSGYETLASLETTNQPISGTIFTHDIRMLDATGVTDMKEIKVIIKWNPGAKNVTLQTLVLKP